MFKKIGKISKWIATFAFFLFLAFLGSVMYRFPPIHKHFSPVANKYGAQLVETSKEVWNDPLNRKGVEHSQKEEVVLKRTTEVTPPTAEQTSGEEPKRLEKKKEEGTIGERLYNLGRDILAFFFSKLIAFLCYPPVFYSLALSVTFALFWYLPAWGWVKTVFFFFWTDHPRIGIILTISVAFVWYFFFHFSREEEDEMTT